MKANFVGLSMLSLASEANCVSRVGYQGVSFRGSQRFDVFDETGIYFVKPLKTRNLSFSVCCTFTCSSRTFDVCSWEDSLQTSCFQKQWAHQVGQLQPLKREKFVKVKLAQVRISLPLWFPSGTHFNWSELPNGRRGNFPSGCCFTHRWVPPDFREPQTIRRYLHSVIDTDRKQ